MSCDVWHRVFQRTMHELAAWRGRVREGVDVENAVDFARYVQMSGICELMTSQPHKGKNRRHIERLRELFPYDGQKLYDEARALEMACTEYWSGRTLAAPGTATGANKSDLESIAGKLDAITGRLNALESVKPARVRKPVLRVVKEGVAS
jgi:hypothetical protein